ncbi:MAG: PD-(D/E)XK nuclease family protein [Gemmatimonadaceae bacterium]
MSGRSPVSRAVPRRAPADGPGLAGSAAAPPTPAPLTDADVEARIREMFARNLAELQAEGGHPLAPEVRETALVQVLLYWRRLRELAQSVTDTEVKLNLPNQRTPRGRPFAIEGVVDIVREDGRTTLYDVKTHPPDVIRADPGPYERQLNVYAHIWRVLRGEPLDATAIICTALPRALEQAAKGGDQAAIARELPRWDPVIPLAFDARGVDETVRDFGATVDRIEERRFDPPGDDVLRRPLPGMTRPFATAVCRNCDARFSCAPYRRYLGAGRARAGEAGYARYVRDLYDDYGDDPAREAVLGAALDALPAALPDDLA